MNLADETKMTTETNVLDLGLRDYGEVLGLQRKLVELRVRKLIPDTLLIVEHPHVFTVGKAVSGEIPNQVDGVPVFRIERGGQWTYHGPGQLVGYPILDLNLRRRDIHGFLRAIEETIILSLRDFGINGGRGKQTGVWIDERKIASIGAAIRNWTSFHGFALNVNTNLDYFQKISPCGFHWSTMTSMKAELRHQVSLSLVRESVLNGFENAFYVKLTRVGIDSVQATIANMA